MKKVLASAATVMGSFAVSSLALAQTHEGAAGGLGLAAIGAGLAIGLAAFGAATGQSRAAAAALEGIARNPGAANEVKTPMLLSLVFMEFQALLGFVIAFLILGKI